METQDIKTGEISELIKNSLSPAGDLYLTRSRAGDLIRWLQITEKLWKEQDQLVKDLQATLKRAGILGPIIVLLLAVFLFAGPGAKADENGGWFCSEDSGKRMGNIYWSCGMNSDLDESGARLGALKDALLQFDLICEASSDCARKPRSVEPRRTSCKQLKNGLWSCSKLLVITVFE